MTCYGCGAEGGDSVRLCPACIILRKRKSGENVRPLLESNEETISDPTLIFDNPYFQLIGGTILAMIIFLYFFQFGGYREIGVYESVIYGIKMVCWFIATLTWLIFWMHMIVTDAMWAIGSFIMPALVYRYAFFNWHDNRVKVTFCIHIVFAVAAFCLTLLLPLNKKEVRDYIGYSSDYYLEDSAEVPSYP